MKVVIAVEDWKSEDVEKLILKILCPGGTLKSRQLWRDVRAEAEDEGRLGPSNHYIEKTLQLLVASGRMKVKKLSQKRGEDERYWTLA